MSRETLEAIDNAIRAHYAETFADIPEVKPIVTAWVVAVEVQTIEDQEIIWDNDYATAETTSPNTAIGLTVWASDRLRGLTAVEDTDDEE